jgi:hypothetical protein
MGTMIRSVLYAKRVRKSGNISIVMKRMSKMQLRELTKALAKGLDVRWSNNGYKVHWDGDVIMVTYEANGFTGALDVEEIKDCYIRIGAK